MTVEKTDVLIIGSGIAGIRAAIEAQEQGVDVIMATKGALCKDGASSWMAGNGFQAALYSPDSLNAHLKDTIIGGKFLNNQRLAKTFLEHDAAVKVGTREELLNVLSELLRDEKMRASLGRNSKALLERSKGATEKNICEVAKLISKSEKGRAG